MKYVSLCANKKPTKLHDLFYMPNRLTNNHCQFKDIRRTVYGLFFQKHAFYIEISMRNFYNHKLFCNIRC